MQKKTIFKAIGWLSILFGVAVLVVKLTFVDENTYSLNPKEMFSQMVISGLVLLGIYNLYKGYSKED